MKRKKRNDISFNIGIGMCILSALLSIFGLAHTAVNIIILILGIGLMATAKAKR